MILVLVPEFFDLEQLEKLGKLDEIRSTYIEPTVVSSSGKINVDIELRFVDSNAYDMLIILSSPKIPQLADYPEVLNIIRLFNNSKKTIAAVALAPYLLARAGILKGKRATIQPVDFALVEFVRQGVNYIDQELVNDGHIYTAQSLESLISMLFRMHK
jgi:protease I